MLQLPDAQHVGMATAAGSWPGGSSSAAALCGMLHASGDAVGSVPVAVRWTLHDVGAAEVSAQAAACARHGGFVRHAQAFDNGLFGVSPAEAAAMDPQQRLLLGSGYEALHGGGWRREALLGGDTGVLLGIERPDWAAVQAAASRRSSVYDVTSSTISIACGRLSFALGMQGPCESIDVACASGLVALHAAAVAVGRGADLANLV